jgi:hypothetical protein
MAAGEESQGTEPERTAWEDNRAEELCDGTGGHEVKKFCVWPSPHFRPCKRHCKSVSFDFIMVWDKNLQVKFKLRASFQVFICKENLISASLRHGQIAYNCTLMTEPANDQPSDPHDLIPPKPIDMEFVQALPDAMLIALLAILTHTDFVDSPNFQSQVAFIRDALEEYSEAGITHREIGRALGCHHHSIHQQLRKLAKTPNPNGRPRPPTAAYQLIVETVTQQFRDRDPATIHKLAERIEAKYDIAMSNDTL